MLIYYLKKIFLGFKHLLIFWILIRINTICLRVNLINLFGADFTFRDFFFINLFFDSFFYFQNFFFFNIILHFS